MTVDLQGEPAELPFTFAVDETGRAIRPWATCVRLSPPERVRACRAPVAGRLTSVWSS